MSEHEYKLVVHSTTFEPEVATGIAARLPLVDAQASASEVEGAVVVVFPTYEDKRTYIDLANAATNGAAAEERLISVDKEIRRKNGGVEKRIVEGKVYTVVPTKQPRKPDENRRTGRGHMGRTRPRHIGTGRVGRRS